MLCCDVFTEMVNEAGRKGFGIVPYRFAEDDNYFFIMQFRSLDAEDKIGRLIVGQMGIKYCPWCGTPLDQVINQNKKLIAEMAEKNKGLVT